MEKMVLLSKCSDFMDSLLHLRHKEDLKDHRCGRRRSKNKKLSNKIIKKNDKVLQEILSSRERPLLKNCHNQISKAKRKLQQISGKGRDCFCPKRQKDLKSLHRR
jgi:DNA anti-recombination protein RmuC